MYTMKISFKQIILPLLIRHCTFCLEKNIHGKNEAFLPLELLAYMKDFDQSAPDSKFRDI